MNNNMFYALLLASFISTHTFAAVTVQEFRDLSKDFISFIEPHASKAIPGYKQEIKLIESDRFLAYGWRPMTFATRVIESPLMTKDAVALIMCHEIGHNLTIARYYTPENSVYDFSHLEQDYYAAYNCFTPFILSSSTSRDILNPSEISKIPLGLQTQCETQHEQPEICLRALHASIVTLLSIYEALPQLHKAKGPPSFERQWLGPSDELQARLLNFINAIFKENPFYMNPVPETEDVLDFKL